MRAGQRLQGAASLDEDAAPRRTRDAGNECDRRGQDKRARGSRDKHREAANDISRYQPCAEGDRAGEWKEKEGVAVREPRERRLGGLRGRDQLHDAGVSAVPGERGGVDLEGCSRIERAAENPPSFGLGDGNGLAGQRQFIDGRRWRHDIAVDRNDLASLDDELIAHFDALDGRVLDPFRNTAVGEAGGSIDERAQTALGPRDCDFLKHIAAGIHERDDGPSERLVERDGCAHGNERNGVDADPPGGKVSNDRDGESGDDRDCRNGPAQLRQFGPVHETRNAAGGQAGNRDRYERPARDTFN